MNKIVIIIVIIIIAAAGFYLMNQKGTWSVSNSNEDSGITQEDGSGGTSDGQNTDTAPEKTQAQKDIESIEANFVQLASDFDDSTPFTIQRVWVQTDKFYVEYQNKGGMLGQVLVVKEGGQFRGKGYFSPSEAGWDLQAGEGELASPSAALYEKDAAGSWMKKS